jgi:PEP-CTERM motif-containing protein
MTKESVASKIGEKRIINNWSVYAAAAGATLAMAANADASIIYSGPMDLTVTGSENNISSKTFKIDGDPIAAELNLFAEDGFRVNVAEVINFSSKVHFAGTNTGGLSFGKKYNLNQQISFAGAGGGGTLQKSSNNGVHGQWGPGIVTGFLGIELPGSDYGWIEVRVTNTGNLPTKEEILGWAYNDAGTIEAGELPSPTPEPGTAGLALLALGSAGLIAWRRRRGTHVQTQVPAQVQTQAQA